MPDVFVKRERKVHPGFNMQVVMNRKPTKGAVGLEIEVEGNKFPKVPGYEVSRQPVRMPGLPYWSYVHDGSLRGHDNAEYILTKPIEFADVPKAMEQLFTALKEFGSVMDDSNRTSTHVHLNCQEFHLNRLTSFMALWYTVEEILTAWCGEHRVGNLFCLRAMDAPAIIAQLRKFIKNDGQSQLSEHLHYAGLNAHALAKFGSLEVRTLRGCSDPQTIIDWVSILERLYVLSAEYDDPRDICGAFSSEGPLAFFEKILGDRVPIVRAAIDYSDDQIRDAMYTGVRLAQDLCYCRDWGEYKAMKLKPDPFSRDLKKVAKRLQAEPMTATAAPVDEYSDGEPDYDDEYISESDFQEAFAEVAVAAPASLSQAMNAAMQQQPINNYANPFDLPAWSTTDG
jgi:hypothetical protein